jgi:hypothetical protein
MSKIIVARFEVLTAVLMGFWVVKLCRLENGYRRVESIMIPRNIGSYLAVGMA